MKLFFKWKQQLANLLFKVCSKFTKLFLVFTQINPIFEIEIAIKEQQFVWKLKNLTPVWFRIVYKFGWFFFLSGICWEKKCPLLEGAGYAAIKPAKLSAVEINRTTTHLKQVLQSLLLQDQNIQHFVSYTVAESVFSRGNHNTMAGFVMFLIWHISSFLTFLMPFLISEFPSCWLSNRLRRHKKDFLKTSCIP